MAAAPPPPQQQVAVQPPQAPQFLLYPGEAEGEGFLDYSESGNQKRYAKATSSLYDDGEGCNMSEGSPTPFLQRVEARGNDHGWNGNFKITKDGKVYDMLKEYGCIKEEDVRSHEETYIATPTAKAQRSYQIFRCIQNSLSDSARMRLIGLESHWTVNIVVNAVSQLFLSGPLLLYYIVQQMTLDTNAAAYNLKMELIDTPTILSKVQNNIVNFNIEIRRLVEALKARGVASEDLVFYLFNGLKTCKDKAFIEWLKQRKDEYDLGKAFTAEELMRLAEQKYLNLIKDGTWEAPSAEQEQIIALTAQLKKVQEKVNKRVTSSTERRGQQEKDKDEEKANTTTTTRQGKRGIPEWKLKEPKGNEPRQKKDPKTGKMNYWCPKHKKFCVHKPSECKGIGYKPMPKDDNTASTVTSAPRTEEEKKKEQEKLRIARALVAIEDSAKE